MKSNYDFSQAIRGKYTRRYAKGANVVILEPDVAKVFPTSKAQRPVSAEPVANCDFKFPRRGGPLT